VLGLADCLVVSFYMVGYATSFGGTYSKSGETILKWQIGVGRWPPPLFNLGIWLWALIGHFPAATWHPMIGSRGGQLLFNVNHLHGHPAKSPICTVSLPRIVRTTTWHFLIGPCVSLKMSNLSDTWQPLVFPSQHAVVIMTHVAL
jgi:hypothetical protein